MDPFHLKALPDAFDHEQVVLCQDPAAGLKAVIAIHSTALGSALGGARVRAYATDEEAVADALHLSRGMSYKNALAGLDFGGGKAVIIGDPARVKTEELLLSFGRFVASLGGRYTTACDLGTDVADMDVVARVCPWTAGHSRSTDGTDSTTSATALGLFQAMRAAAGHRWGEASLRDRVVGVAGVGKVGRLLVRHLVGAGARVVVTDLLDAPVRQVLAEFPGVVAVDDTDALIRTPLDVYAPCAVGGVLDESVVPVLTAAVVCGAANNQLAHPDVEQRLADRGVLYVPDYVANAGGAIHAAGELRGLPPDQLTTRVAEVFETTSAILARAEAEGVLPGAAADLLAEQRMGAAAGR
ncbi:Glu/Leu/Phe/Val dehydrogenase dimerization domain-containing protein [Saccharothrix obliqua]|uniref:Glu/Leu/Phe/Val dehydrogenase dimerization domain-containing protein n=1 Tax=Saccharothrix obliqua TaxID=2861747 RepID=UPI001C5D1CB2|nr:Glu/Leu/Phe/Val dehydrogenase dimerization domain-containing protein [Saccharothrix obliqua]MBW4717215.1 valine dehydrogenase [Saccharothrix obliqua]